MFHSLSTPKEGQGPGEESSRGKRCVSHGNLYLSVLIVIKKSIMCKGVVGGILFHALFSTGLMVAAKRREGENAQKTPSGLDP